MFGTIRRHQNWLWVVIITIIIFTFVIWFSPDVTLRGRRTDTTSEFGTIDGKPISLDEYRPAYTEAIINHWLRSGGREWPDAKAEETLKRDAITRVFLLRKLKEHDIHVSSQAISRLARERLGENVMNNLNAFEKEYLAQGGISLDQFARYLQHEAGIQQLLQVASASARLINPREAEELFRQDHERLATEVAVFSASNYLGQVNVSPDAITNYFNRQQAQYRVPERIEVAYVEFPVSNFLAVAEQEMAKRTNLDAMITEAFFQRGPENFKDTNGVKLPEDKAKAQLKDEVRRDFALREAHRKANEFGTELYNKEVTNIVQFDKIAADRELKVKVTDPFDRMKGLDEAAFPPAFRQKALALAPQQPISFQPVIGSNAVYVIALKRKVASEMPPLEKIRQQVENDFKLSQANDIARREGNAFHAAVTNALNQKKTFADAVAASKAKVVTVPPFAAATPLTNAPAGVNPRMLQNIAQNLKPGEASQFIPTMDGGMVVYLKERLPVSEAEVKEKLPEFVGRLRFYRQNEAFNQWFRKEAERAKLVVPQRENVGAPTGSAAKSKR